jgi:hypothetical protein
MDLSIVVKYELYMKSALYLLLLVSVVIPRISVAEDPDLICAAVLPCNPDGSVQEAFAHGDCAPQYARQCAAQKKSEDASQEMQSCTQENQDLHSAMRKLQRSLKNSKKKIRQLARAARR